MCLSVSSFHIYVVIIVTKHFKVIYIFLGVRGAWQPFHSRGGAPEPGGGLAVLRLLQEPVLARVYPTRSAGAGPPRRLIQ